MRKKSPEVASNQFLDLDSDWNDALAPSAADKNHRPSGKGRLRGHFDGASRGNPGEAGAGAVLFDGQGAPVWECARPLGKKTNNEAEYLALLLLLEELERRGVSADIRGDSRLVVNQVTGRWKINEPRLKELADRAVELLRRTKSSLSWVAREENAAADRLSNSKWKVTQMEKWFVLQLVEQFAKTSAHCGHTSDSLIVSEKIELLAVRVEN